MVDEREEKKKPEEPESPEKKRKPDDKKKVSRRTFGRKAAGVGLGVITGSLGAAASSYFPPQVDDLGQSGLNPKNESRPAYTRRSIIQEGTRAIDWCESGDEPGKIPGDHGICVDSGTYPHVGDCDHFGTIPDGDCVNAGATPVTGVCLENGNLPALGYCQDSGYYPAATAGACQAGEHPRGTDPDDVCYHNGNYPVSRVCQSTGKSC